MSYKITSKEQGRGDYRNKGQYRMDVINLKICLKDPGNEEQTDPKHIKQNNTIKSRV